MVMVVDRTDRCRGWDGAGALNVLEGSVPGRRVLFGEVGVVVMMT
jgi:hypothetical protein